MAAKKWTVMAYMAGDNSLADNGVTDLTEMKSAGSTGDVNLVAQFDQAGSPSRTRRFFLRKNTSLDSDEVADLGKTDTGSPDVLDRFIQWGVGSYPAGHYLLVLWNHGNGWDDTNVYRGAFGADARVMRPQRVRHAFFRTSVEKAAGMMARDPRVMRGILYDDDAKDFIDDTELKGVLAAARNLLGRPLDVLGMDACLMSMAEVAYQVRESVNLSVGSEETEPGDGWPYNTVLGALTANPDMAPADLARTIVTCYAASYGAGDAVTQSALSLAAGARLADAVKVLGTELGKCLAGSALLELMKCRTRVQKFEVKDNVDLVHLCLLLAKAKLPASARAAAKAAAAAAQAMTVAAKYKGTPMKNSHGLALYFPLYAVSPLYARLDFAAATGWDRFIKAYVQATAG